MVRFLQKPDRQENISAPTCTNGNLLGLSLGAFTYKKELGLETKDICQKKTEGVAHYFMGAAIVILRYSTGP
jgi:hypothetical protein